MYGQIHCVIRELVETKFGQEAWETILAKSGLDEHNSFLMFTRYNDESTFKLVGAVSDTLGVSVEAVLEIFGEFFFDYCLRHGYDKMLRTLGSDIKSFIQNLDSLHSLLAMSYNYKGISAPSFRCEDGMSGDLILHYYSGRPGLYPIVKGVLKAVARDLFQQSLEMTIIEQHKEDIGLNQTQEHTAFRCQLKSENEGKSRTPTPNSSINRSLVEFKPETILLKASDFCSAFPYHIIFNQSLKIRQCGDLIQKHAHVRIHDGTSLNKVFQIVHPKMVLSIENIRKFINAVFLLAITPKQNGQKTLVLKGQMIWIQDTQMMIFIGSPRLTSLNELMEMNVYLADIPLYDVTRELVLLNQQRIAEIDIAKKLDETTAELKKTWQALKKEKQKTETLLHQMLPLKVAKALTNNEKVEAEKFDQVTILFSDIVTFTNIATACSPMDIVNMLNDMYQRFDARTSQHNVYKVETIGDAYMIVSGVPEKTNVHAQPVANFAMDMIEDAGLVQSPATGRPLQIRVGVHTGPVVAGVVGVKMPRYCLFGDTVNTASRMESHGMPGRIHLSPTVYQALSGWGYAFKHRGDMEVKGKGKMSTYFLCGHLNRRLDERQDEFSDLEVHVDGTENGNGVEVSEMVADMEPVDVESNPVSSEATNSKSLPTTDSTPGMKETPDSKSLTAPRQNKDKDDTSQTSDHFREDSNTANGKRNSIPVVTVSHVTSCCRPNRSAQHSNSVSPTGENETSPNEVQTQPNLSSSTNGSTSASAAHRSSLLPSLYPPSEENEGHANSCNGTHVEDCENNHHGGKDTGNGCSNSTRTGGMVRSQTCPHPFVDACSFPTLPLSTSHGQLNTTQEKIQKKKRKKENSKLCLLS